jgi:hypothetical protein
MEVAWTLARNASKCVMSSCNKEYASLIKLRELQTVATPVAI